MKIASKHICLLASAALALSACNESSVIGASTVQDKIAVVIDSAFTVTGQSVPMHRVQSRTVSHLIGCVDVDGFGRIKSDVVTQFMPASQLFTNEVTVEDIDSLVMYFFVSKGHYVGDSIAPMGLTVYPLTRDLPSPIYSDFDPTGYYDAANPLGSAIYNVSQRSAHAFSDSTFAEGVEIKVKMPLELGRNIFAAYKQNPESFSSPTAFANNVFKGVYIENSFGSGRLVYSSAMLMTMYYSHYYADQDTTISGEGNYFAVTPEVITNNDVATTLDKSILDRVAAGEKIVAAPLGLEVEMRFPAPELLASYRSNPSDLQVLNTLTFSLPAKTLSGSAQVGTPIYLLMVLKKDRDDFFANNKLPNSITSFYAKFDEQTSTYNFGDMSAYMLSLLDKDEVTEDDYTFVVLPVAATFETSNQQSYYYTSTATLSMMVPYMSVPAAVSLLLDKAQIKMSYSTQTISNN